MDYENKHVNKGELCCIGEVYTNTNINYEVQYHKKAAEDNVEVETFIQEDLVEGKWEDEIKTSHIRSDTVNNEQIVFLTTDRLPIEQGNSATSERLLTEQGNCVNYMKNNEDSNINEEHGNHCDYADAPLGTRERPSSPYAKYRESLIVSFPDVSGDISDGGRIKLYEDDAINVGSNDYTDLYKYSEGTILKGNMTLQILRSSVRYLERPLSFFLAIVSVLLFLADIVTDCLLAGEYYNKAKMELFYATVVFIIGPAVILSVVDLSWLYIDIKKRQSSDQRGNEWINRKWIFTFRVLLGLVSLGRIVRCLQYIYHYLVFTKIKKSETGRRGTERLYQKSRAKEERRDFYMLDFINVFTESGLQLIVQLFLFFQYDLNLDVIRVSSLFTSWISIAWTLVSYYTYNRDAISRKQAPTLIGICVYFIARACELAARIIAIALFVTIFHFWGFLLVFHFLAMLLWLGIFSRPKLDDIASTMFGKVLYTILYAFVLIFCFINLEEKQTFKRMLVFYLVLYLESFAMAVLVFIHLLEQDGIHSYKIQSLIIVPLGCGIHLMAQTIYYVCCHPTVREKYQCSNCMACR